MVGMVLVSHSRALAEAVRELAFAMTGPGLPIVVAAGTGEGRNELGTDAMQILEAIEQVYSDQGVVVLMDMGSAILSAETAIDFLDEDKKANVFLCAAPFVEGSVAAAVSIKMNVDVRRVLDEASCALGAKNQHLGATSVSDEAVKPEVPLEDQGASIEVIVPNPAGLHARPAAKFVQEASSLSSKISIRNLSKNKGPVPATSLTSLIMLEARLHDALEIRAAGPDQDAALEHLKKFVLSGMGDALDKAGNHEQHALPKLTRLTPAAENFSAAPIGISAGVVSGPLYRAGKTLPEPSNEKIADIQLEKDRLHRALLISKEKIHARLVELAKNIGKEHAAIFEAQSLVLEDPLLVERAHSLIETQQLSAARAWWMSIQEMIAAYQKLDDEMLRERAADLEDVGREVLSALGHQINSPLEIPEPGILLVNDLTPAEVTSLDAERVLGVICLQGSKTSHSAILLRSRGIAAVGKAGSFLPSLGTINLPALVAIDGETGKVHLNPGGDLLQVIGLKRREQATARAKAKAESSLPATTRSGSHYEIFANVGKPADAIAAAENGADGIGLLRTEFMFLERSSAPDENEQYRELCAIAAPMKGKPVIVRTLDAGGDKELPYLDHAAEENPFLGVRAIRLCLKNRPLFQTQLRAILRAAEEHDIRIMFPMIATLHELEEAKKELSLAHDHLSAENVAHGWPLQVGMMMEVPSAALMASTFVPHVDFVSIGTNDLTQYTLAADRGNMELEGLHDPLNPAVLELIRIIVGACREKKIAAAVCGEAASDQKAAKIFAELGVRELSMSSRLIPAIKAEVRRWP